jgi:hypothetical protein
MVLPGLGPAADYDRITHDPRQWRVTQPPAGSFGQTHRDRDTVNSATEAYAVPARPRPGRTNWQDPRRTGPRANLNGSRKLDRVPSNQARPAQRHGAGPIYLARDNRTGGGPLRPARPP